MTSLDEPALLLVGPSRHGVVTYATDLGRALRRAGFTQKIVGPMDAEAAIRSASEFGRVHVHVTDRLLGGSPEEAATVVERLATITRLSITLHDLPQHSDGLVLARRVHSYERMIAAVDAVAVNSQHEARLLEEHGALDSRSVGVIPLGASTGSERPTASTESDDPVEDAALQVLIAGYIYPGKGHLDAIQAVARAIDRVHAHATLPILGRVVAMGEPSRGHEDEVEALVTEARRRGVDFHITGYLDAFSYRRWATGSGIPLAPHRHVSASRSMLDWAEFGRSPLVAQSRYATEMESLRPGTMSVYAPENLPERLEYAWRNPRSTRLPEGVHLSPTLDDTASAYRRWWGETGRE